MVRAMLHPFEKLDASTRKRALLASFAICTVTTAAMAYVDSKYHTAAAPLGIVNLELARTPAMAQLILDSWSRGTGMNAWVAFGIGFDYLYLLTYGALFALVSASIAAKLAPSAPGLAKIARIVAWLQFVAPICDAVENVGLMAMLSRAGTDPWVTVSTGFALAKFACLGFALSLVVFVGPLALRAKPATENA